MAQPSHAGRSVDRSGERPAAVRRRRGTIELNSRAINRDSRYARQMNKFVLLVSPERVPLIITAGPGHEKGYRSRPRQ